MSPITLDDLVRLATAGRTDQELQRLQPELTPADLEAVRNYSRVPEGLRRSFGGWAEDSVELDKYLEWTRKKRSMG